MREQVFCVGCKKIIFRVFKLYYEARLYIDRLAHWRPSLVDIILKFEPLAEVPKAISE